MNQLHGLHEQYIETCLMRLGLGLTCRCLIMQVAALHVTLVMQSVKIFIMFWLHYGGLLINNEHKRYTFTLYMSLEQG